MFIFNLPLSANIEPLIYRDVFGEYEYSISNGEVTIEKCIGSTRSANIPGEINGLPVTTVNLSSFPESDSYVITITDCEVTPENGLRLRNHFKAFIGSLNPNCKLRVITTSLDVKAYALERGIPCPKSEIIYFTGEDFDGYIRDELQVTFTKYNGTSKDVIIPSKYDGLPVTALGDCIFDSYPMTSVVLPDTLITIGGESFRNCNYLNSITLPKNLAYIYYGAFAMCSQLTSVIIPEGVKLIDDEAFDGCSLLNSITIPKSVVYLGKYVFTNNITIYGYSGSLMEEYAFKNKIPFIALDGEPTLLGDVNGDGEINVVDVIHLAKAIANRITLTDEQIVNANIDGVSGVSSDNLILLIKYLIGEVNF